MSQGGIMFSSLWGYFGSAPAPASAKDSTPVLPAQNTAATSDTASVAAATEIPTPAETVVTSESASVSPDIVKEDQHTVELSASTEEKSQKRETENEPSLILSKEIEQEPPVEALTVEKLERATATELPKLESEPAAEQTRQNQETEEVKPVQPKPQRKNTFKKREAEYKAEIERLKKQIAMMEAQLKLRNAIHKHKVSRSHDSQHSQTDTESKNVSSTVTTSSPTFGSSDDCKSKLFHRKKIVKKQDSVVASKAPSHSLTHR